MPKVAELRNKVYFPSLLAYGPLGTGKSAFFSQLGAEGIYLDFDEGWRTIDTMDDQWTKLRHETDVQLFFEGDFEAPKQFLAARNFIYNLNTRIKKDPTKAPSVVVLDSWTGMLLACKYWVLSNSGHAGKNPERQEWGVMFNELENFMRRFRKLPCIKIVCAHDRLVEDAAGGVKYKLLCPGKNFPTEVAGFFDDVFYCKVKKLSGGKFDYILTSSATSAVEARTRTGFRDDWSMNSGFWPLMEKLGYRGGLKR